MDTPTTELNQELADMAAKGSLMTGLTPTEFTPLPLPKVKWASGRSATKKPSSARARTKTVKGKIVKGVGLKTQHPKPQPSRKAQIRADKRAFNATNKAQ